MLLRYTAVFLVPAPPGTFCPWIKVLSFSLYVGTLIHGTHGKPTVAPLVWWDEVVEHGSKYGETSNGGWRFGMLSCFVFVFAEFCVLRSFRTVGFVAATIVRLGKKQLHY